jgi:hypothetical protein
LKIENESAGNETYFAVEDQLLGEKDSFGGAYLDDNGNLNIMVVDESNVSKSIRDYQNMINKHKSERQTVIYRTVSYSLDTMQKIIDNLMKESETLGILGAYTDQKENIIVVDYDSNSFAKEKVMKIIGDSKIVRFQNSTGLEFQAAVLKNGGKISDHSMACGARLGNTYGFITAAHSGSIGTLKFFNGNLLGAITHRNLGGSADVAFITPASSTFKSTTMFTDMTSYTAGRGSTTNPSDYAFYVSGGFLSGTSVTTYGAGSGKVTGQIIATNSSCIVSGVALNNMVRTTCVTAYGDSGGAVKVYRILSGFGYTYCAGVHCGIIISNGVTNQVYTCMSRAKAALNFYGYYDTTNATIGTCPYAEPTTNLQQGSSGNGVRWIQWWLNCKGFSLTVDGSFGPLTHNAVRTFQSHNNLSVDGIVGPLTRSKLKA